MFETLISNDRALARHRNGPFAAERDRYLRHCADQGGTQGSLLVKARTILRVAERISSDDIGHVDTAGLHAIVNRSPAASLPAPTTAKTLVMVARPWLKFLGWWQEPTAPTVLSPALDGFVAWMRDERGLTQCTIDQWRYRAAEFLRWCSQTDRDLATLQAQDIDAYFVTYGAQRWSRVSANYISTLLRAFLRHAAAAGRCSTKLVGSIQGQPRYALDTLPSSLGWDDVRRLIATASGNTEVDIRDRAVLLLLAVYGLRSGEVAALRIEQIDRLTGRLHIFRLKRRQPQVYPLVSSVGQALARYIDECRPHAPYAEVFLRLCAPRGPIGPGAVNQIVAHRQRQLDIQGSRLGPHALRHACAVKLLADGLTLKEIGDHLGHRSSVSTMTYAKVDLTALRQVADFDLGGLQ